MKAEELLNKAERLRREACFGEAINTFREALSAPDATEDTHPQAEAVGDPRSRRPGKERIIFSPPRGRVRRALSWQILPLETTPTFIV